MLTDHHEIIPFNRNGKLPTVHIVENEDRLNRAICDKVKDLKAEFQTIAIICKTAQEAEKTYEHLCDQIPNMRLIKKETTSYEKGVLVIPSYLAKGIEFDAVIIYNGSKQVFDQEDERKLFYTACTRAMHELYIYSVGEVTPFINDVNPTTFLQING